MGTLRVDQRDITVLRCLMKVARDCTSRVNGIGEDRKHTVILYFGYSRVSLLISFVTSSFTFASASCHPEWTSQ